MLKQLRGILQWLWANCLFASGLLWLVKYQLRRKGSVLVLAFHRVLDEAAFRNTYSQPEIIVKGRTFRQLAAYVSHRYEPVELARCRPGQPSQQMKVAFTFDDGWKDNHDLAFPIVREYRIPVHIFLAAGFIDKDTPFWPEQVIALMRAQTPPTADAEITALIEKMKTLPPADCEQSLISLKEKTCKDGSSLTPSGFDRTLSWPEILEMDRVGIGFGSHTQSHVILTTAALDIARSEVRGSKTDIENALGRTCDTFAYPNGNWSCETRRVVTEEGYRLAVTADPGVWRPNSDPFCIPRVNVYERKLVGPTGQFSPAMLEYTTIWKAWLAMKFRSHRPSPLEEPRRSAKRPELNNQESLL